MAALLQIISLRKQDLFHDIKEKKKKKTENQSTHSKVMAQ